MFVYVYFCSLDTFTPFLVLYRTADSRSTVSFSLSCYISQSLRFLQLFSLIIPLTLTFLTLFFPSLSFIACLFSSSFLLPSSVSFFDGESPLSAFHLFPKSPKVNYIAKKALTNVHWQNEFFKRNHL